MHGPRRIVALVAAALTLTFGAVACGDDEDEDDIIEETDPGAENGEDLESDTTMEEDMESDTTMEEDMESDTTMEEDMESDTTMEEDMEPDEG